MTPTPTTSEFDLLREKRQELNLPEPVAVAAQGRQRLVQGVAIGAALIGLSLGVAVLVLLRALMVSAAVDRLGTVEAEVQLFETQLTSARGKLKGVENANADLVKGLIAVRSGSALMRDLQLRVPAGVAASASRRPHIRHTCDGSRCWRVLPAIANTSTQASTTDRSAAITN